MERLETMLHALPETPLPAGLRARVLAAVADARARQRRARRALFGSLAALSGISLVPAVGFVWQQFAASAFAAYASLLFTDSGAALANWKILLLSLVESAPLVGLTLAAGAAFVFLASLKALAPYVRVRGNFIYQTS